MLTHRPVPELEAAVNGDAHDVDSTNGRGGGHVWCRVDDYVYVITEDAHCRASVSCSPSVRTRISLSVAQSKRWRAYGSATRTREGALDAGGHHVERGVVVNEERSGSGA